MKRVEYEDSKLSKEEKMRLDAAWKKKHRRPDDFLKARNGDHLLVPFECDHCIFYKIRGVVPLLEKESDRNLLSYIRRIILDSMWARAASTVEANCRNSKLMNKMASELDMPGVFIHSCELPKHDHCGYQVAILLLRYSLRKGKYAENLQFETVRKLRPVYSNFIRASPMSNSQTLSFCSEKGVYQRLSHDACGSLWFSRFMEGMRRRMGHIWKPNKTLSSVLLRKLFEVVEEKIQAEVHSPQDRDRWLVFNVYAVISYVISLRGSEGLLLDIGSLIRLWKRGEGKYVIIPLLGKLKGESFDKCHLIPSTEITGSGVRVRQVLHRLIANKTILGIVDGPAISDTRGFVMDPSDIDEMFHEVLLEILQKYPNLFPPDIVDEESVKQGYQCFRSFRRSSATRATEMKVSIADKEIVNRWSKVEKADGNKLNLQMHQHYTNFDDLLQPFLRYTSAM